MVNLFSLMCLVGLVWIGLTRVICWFVVTLVYWLVCCFVDLLFLFCWLVWFSLCGWLVWLCSCGLPVCFSVDLLVGLLFR